MKVTWGSHYAVLQTLFQVNIVTTVHFAALLVETEVLQLWWCCWYLMLLSIVSKMYCGGDITWNGVHKAV